MEELSGEKIDIIPNSGNLGEIIKKSLSPAETLRVEVDEDEAFAKVYILPSERARAVGKG
jgi:N utilization substance protein A